jgi:hypothetical protein
MVMGPGHSEAKVYTPAFTGQYLTPPEVQTGEGTLVDYILFHKVGDFKVTLREPLVLVSCA